MAVSRSESSNGWLGGILSAFNFKAGGEEKEKEKKGGEKKREKKKGKSGSVDGLGDFGEFGYHAANAGDIGK